jgi:ubiquinone/menaquinone biosynthesis C-methylase UbiE
VRSVTRDAGHPSSPLTTSHDAFTQETWEEVWASSAPNYDPAEPQLRDSLALIERFWPERSGRFLEAGCGSAANALNLAQRGADVAGIDLSPSGLSMAKSAFAERGLRGEFLRGDVREIPFPDESFEFVYAGGVVEHFVETDQAVAEMVRVLRPGGRLLLTVPALTLSYSYLFLRGNIPAVPMVEEAMSFVQLRLLRGAFAAFGYERSFRPRAIRRLLVDARLGSVEVRRFDTYLPLLQMPRRLRGPARRLARTNAFAPMYYGTGVRQNGSAS